MTRGSIKHEEIHNEYRRNAMFRKRRDGLLKKANELSILCGVDVGIVIHKKEQSNAVLWPSPESFRSRVQKFMEFRDEERKRRMSTHEGLVKQMVQGEMENLEKLKNAIQLKESQQLVVKSMQTNSFNGFGIDQLNAMNSFADHMLKKLQQRDNDLNAK
ncbi:MADS-box transcription factor PHERES 1-like [Salvia splendens]|nr:MADS-box transcription factor PHERES 1-like [Salvia splendens]